MKKKRLSDGPVEMVIANASVVEGEYGTQIKFVGREQGATEDTVLYVSERSAARQLDRLALNVHSLPGEALRFEQVTKGDRKYNNIYRSTIASAPQQDEPFAEPTAPAVASAPSPKAGAYDLYAECLSNAARMVLAMSDETGVSVSGSDVVAAAATLYIQANRR